jgi:PAS domain S-box-containing protein
MQKIYKEDLVDLINDIQHPIWIYDIHTSKILSVNKTAVKLLGYSVEEFRNMTILDIRSSEELNYYEKFGTWKSYSMGLNDYYKLRKKDGSELFVEIKRKVITYNKHDAILSTGYDLTQRINSELKLKESEERFRVSQEISPDGFTIMNCLRDDSGEIIDFIWEYVNPAAAKIMGKTVEELTGARLLEKLPGNSKELFNLYIKVVRTGESHDLEIEYNSENINGWFRNVAVKLGEGIAISFNDITERKKHQAAIEQINKEMRDTVERISDAFIAIDKNWYITYANNTALKIMNIDRSVMGKKVMDAIPPVNMKITLMEYVKKAMNYQEPQIFDYEEKLTDRWYRISVYPSPDGVSIFALDTTVSRAYEEQLLNSLNEKETLLKEVHHRIKNNLQIIVSILNLQSFYIKDKESLEIFRQSQNRIRSMALIHEKLYRTETLSSVNLENYIADITKYLSETYSLGSEKINFIFDMDNIELDSNTAISFGLIVNELISNSIKYAFPESRRGNIKITARLKNSDMIFEVWDNGRGFPAEIDFKDTNSLGLQLVNTLVEQLQGKLELDTSSGTLFRITMLHKKENASHREKEEKRIKHSVVKI